MVVSLLLSARALRPRARSPSIAGARPTVARSGPPPRHAWRARPSTAGSARARRPRRRLRGRGAPARRRRRPATRGGTRDETPPRRACAALAVAATAPRSRPGARARATARCRASPAWPAPRPSSRARGRGPAPVAPSGSPPPPRLRPHRRPRAAAAPKRTAAARDPALPVRGPPSPPPPRWPAPTGRRTPGDSRGHASRRRVHRGRRPARSCVSGGVDTEQVLAAHDGEIDPALLVVEPARVRPRQRIARGPERPDVSQRLAAPAARQHLVVRVI